MSKPQLKSKYVIGSAPHIRTSESVSGFLWKQLLVMAVILLASFIQFQWQAVQLAAISVVAVLAAEFLANRMYRQKEFLQDLSSFVTGFIFILLLPASMPWWAVFLGAFLGAFLAKECFGGLGQNVFQPAFLGLGILIMGFPMLSGVFEEASLKTFTSAMSQGAHSGTSSFFWYHGSMINETCFFLLYAGAFYLMMQKVIDWQLPLIYLLVYGLLSFLLGSGQEFGLFSGIVLVTAFYGVTDTATTPMTRTGSRVFALGAAVLSVLFKAKLGMIGACVLAVLLMNVLTPWLDAWIKPKALGALAKGRGA